MLFDLGQIWILLLSPSLQDYEVAFDNKSILIQDYELAFDNKAWKESTDQEIVRWISEHPQVRDPPP